MRRVIVGIGTAALVATAFTAVPPAAAQAAAQDAAPAVTPAPNPFIEETCGLDATLILDASGSIQSAGAVNTVRNAGYDLLAALKDTNSTLRITQFGTFSGQLSSRVPVDATTTGSGGSLAKAMANYYTPPPPKPAGVTIYNGNQIQNSALTWTNWEDGIKGIDRPELAIYMTDGDPTAYNVNASRTNVNTSVDGTALDHAITQANILKNDGTRMLVVGVGSGLTSTASQNRLKQISGPLLEKSPAALAGKTINQVDAVAFSDFAALGAFLRSVVTSLCGNSVTIKKLAQTADGSDYVPATGWNMTVQPTVSGGFKWVDPTGPDNSAQTRATSGAQGSAAFQWKPKVANQKATVQVTEQLKTDFNANRWSCDVKDEDGGTTTVSGNLTNQNPSFTFDMYPSDVATCSLYNDFKYAPGLSVTKVARDDPVRGNGVGWDEEYTFTVTNTGNTPLTIAKPVDPKCTTITGPTGPGAATGKLQPGTAWTYTCAAKIGPVATTTQPLVRGNTVTVTGIDPTGTPVTQSAQEEVDVKTPAIRIDKTAKKTAGGAPIPDGGWVVAGTSVTYVYSVSNTGNDTLNLVRATAVTDDKCSPVTYKSGDTNNNQKLETTETWLYECVKTLNPPSSVTSITNTASVTSTWSNPQNRPQNNGAVTDSDTMTIDIDRSASLRIIKTTNPADVDQDFPFTVSGPGVSPDDQSFDLNTSSDPQTPPATRTIELDGPNGQGSVYTIAEGDVPGWALQGVTCTKPVTQTGNSVQVTILPTDDVTCTFPNARLPRLTITKQTNPGGSDKTFGFTSSATPGTFSLQDGQSQPITGFVPGSVDVTEATVPAGWELDAIDCNGFPFTRSGNRLSVSLDYGDDVECTFRNGELAPANLTIVKDAEPATWPAAFDFSAAGIGMETAGVNATKNFTLSLGGSKTYSVRPVAAGNTYRITEKALPTPPGGESGFALTAISCVVNGNTATPITGDTGTGVVDVTLKPTDSAVCTYTNKQLPRLTIVKNAVNPDGAPDDTPFTFNATGLTPDTFALKNSANQQSFTDMLPGAAFTVTEAPVTDWTLTSLECTGPGSLAVTVDVSSRRISSGGLTYGADVVCTYVNTKDPAKGYLFVLKNTDPTGSPASFDFNATDGNAFNEDFPLTDGDFQGFEVEPGRDYTVTEAPKPGWKLTEVDCVVSSDPTMSFPGDLNGRSATVRIESGEVAVCVFENQQFGTLTIDKVTDVQSSTSFPFTATGVTPTSFSLTGGGVPQRYTDLAAGTDVSITENVPTSPPDRWKLAGITCDGSSTAPVISGSTATVKVGAGEDVECTFSDAKVPPATVEIVKSADPANGTPFQFTASGQDQGSVKPADEQFTLTPTGGPAEKILTVYPRAGGEVFTFTESWTAQGWNLDDITCQDRLGTVGTPNVPAGRLDVTVKPGDTITCTFTNRADATLTVVKEAPDDPTLPFDFSWTLTPNTFSLKDQESRTKTALLPGKVTVQETNLPTDWYLDGPNGKHPTCTGGDNPVDYSPALGAEVDLKAGEDVTCTFANFFNYDPKIELTKTPDRSVVLDGKPVVYTYTVKNTGNVPVVPVGDVADVVTDDQCRPVSVQSAIFPLRPGESAVFTCTVTSMTPAKATNIATATVKDPLDPDKTLTATDTQTVEVLVPEVKLEKTVDQPIVYPNTSVTYTYVATNTGQTPFKGPQDKAAWMSDDKCSPVTYVSGDTGGDSVMAVGEAWTYSCSTSISVDTENTGTFTGTPFVPASQQSGPEQTGDPIQVTDKAQVDVIQKGITITKTPSAPGGVVKDGTLIVPVGTEVTYTYEVTSGEATVPMDVIDVADNTCAPVEYQSGDDGDGMVEPGETWIYTCKTVFAGVTTVSNTVLVEAVEPILGGLSEDTAQAVVRSYKGSIAIKKSPSAELVQKGTPVTYTYTALNDGTVDLTDVTVSDDKCAPVKYVSGDDGDRVMRPGEEWVFTCTSTLNDDVTNVAEATGTTPSGGKVTDSTSVTVLVIGGRLKPVIAVTKTPSATKIPQGDQVTYRYEVTNAGTMPLANIRVSDNKCSPVTYVSGDDNGDGLLTSSSNGEGWPDETWVYTCTTRLDKDTTNTVTALGAPWDKGQVVGPDVSATAVATVTVTKVLPIHVDPVNTCKGDTCTVVKKSKTNKYGTLSYRVRCRPVGSSATGEVRFCRTKVTKAGAVKVRVLGYPKVKVTVWITAKPKPKYKDTWKPNTWKRTWIVRP